MDLENSQIYGSFHYYSTSVPLSFFSVFLRWTLNTNNTLLLIKMSNLNEEVAQKYRWRCSMSGVLSVKIFAWHHKNSLRFNNVSIRE
jgi:hypothetical protein